MPKGLSKRKSLDGLEEDAAHVLEEAGLRKRAIAECS